MDLFILDEEVFKLETALSLLENSHRLDVLIPLAWHLRQRDCQRAHSLISEANELLKTVTLDHHVYQTFVARIALIQGEIHWLFAELEQAEHFALDAINQFENLNDPIGIGDGYFLLTSIQRDHGQIKKRDYYLQSALEQYCRSGDILRQQIAKARQLHNCAIRDPKRCAKLLLQQFPKTANYHATVDAWISSASAIVANKIGDLGES
ncbi:MAG: hypothetical protein K2P84_02910, partial [Undibacterium sp.]|nr:hypothetical protein [Undibacterium sp.]